MALMLIFSGAPIGRSSAEKSPLFWLVIPLRSVSWGLPVFGALAIFRSMTEARAIPWPVLSTTLPKRWPLEAAGPMAPLFGLPGLPGGGPPAGGPWAMSWLSAREVQRRSISFFIGQN